MNTKSYHFNIDRMSISITKFGSWWQASAKKNKKFITWGDSSKCLVAELPHLAAVGLAEKLGIDQGKMMNVWDRVSG